MQHLFCVLRRRGRRDHQVFAQGGHGSTLEHSSKPICAQQLAKRTRAQRRASTTSRAEEGPDRFLQNVWRAALAIESTAWRRGWARTSSNSRQQHEPSPRLLDGILVCLPTSCRFDRAEHTPLLTGSVTANVLRTQRPDRNGAISSNDRTGQPAARAHPQAVVCWQQSEGETRPRAV